MDINDDSLYRNLSALEIFYLFLHFLFYNSNSIIFSTLSKSLEKCTPSKLDSSHIIFLLSLVGPLLKRISQDSNNGISVLIAH
jgi:hypothetical protein